MSLKVKVTIFTFIVTPYRKGSEYFGQGIIDGVVTGLRIGRPRNLGLMLTKIQPDATVCRYLFTAKSLYMFWVSQHPSSGVLKTVTAASGTGHNIGTASSLQCGLIRPRWREIAVPIL